MDLYFIFLYSIKNLPIGAKALIIFAFVCVLFYLFNAICHYYERKRGEALRRISQTIGFSFSSEPEENIIESLNQFNLFQQGSEIKIMNILKGIRNNISWLIFDCVYWVSAGPGSAAPHYYYNVAYAYMNGYNLPKFSMKPRLFGRTGLVFNDNLIFSKKYFLESTDEEAIRKLFTPKLLNFITIETQTKKGIYIEGCEDKIIFYHDRNTAISLKNLSKFLDEISQIVHLLGAAYIQSKR